MPRYHRKIIRITGEDSPNVRLALAQIRAGQQPTNEILVPGVLPWADYQKRMATWDEVKKCIGIHAQFWEGADAFLYPPHWLDRANQLAEALRGVPRQAKGIGIDAAEGGDDTAMCAVDEWGIVELVSKKTPNTALIPNEAIAFIQRHNVPADRCIFDQGGGGKQAADQLRARGYNVRTVAFGSAVSQELRGVISRKAKMSRLEERYTYFNRRAELYGHLRELLDPGVDDPYSLSAATPTPTPTTIAPQNSVGPSSFVDTVLATQRAPADRPLGFAIPAVYTTLRQELAPIPLLYDSEGRLYLPAKRRKGAQSNREADAGPRGTAEKTLTELIGHSPDQADALVLACHAMLHRIHRPRAGRLFEH